MFDYLTFGALLYWLQAKEREFQTGWFIESLMTESFIVLVIRTRGRFYRSWPGTLLLAATLFVAGTTIILPYTPLGALFGFVPLPPSFVLLPLAITGAYLVASELVKGWFFRRFAWGWRRRLWPTATSTCSSMGTSATSFCRTASAQPYTFAHLRIPQGWHAQCSTCVLHTRPASRGTWSKDLERLDVLRGGPTNP